MKCCSRYNFGITIGSLYIVGAIIALIIFCIVHTEYDKVEDPERREELKAGAIQSIVTSFVVALISSLFIVAIVKKYEYLILPWLVLAIYLFYLSCGTFYWWYIGALMGGASLSVFLILVLITIVTFGDQIAIFCFSISLFRQIRNENAESPESFPVSYENQKHLI